MDKTEKCIKENLIYKGKILSLYRDEVKVPSGNISYREIVRHNGGVCALAVHNNEIYFVKQYRYAYKMELLELPAGKMEENETKEESIRRELREEIGFISKDLKYIGYMYPSPGYTDEVIHLFSSLDNDITDTNFDPDEFLDIIHLPIKKAYEMLDNNEIVDAKSVILLQKLRKVLLDD